jgi:hypothetical protein
MLPGGTFVTFASCMRGSFSSAVSCILKMELMKSSSWVPFSRISLRRDRAASGDAGDGGSLVVDVEGGMGDALCKGCELDALALGLGTGLLISDGNDVGDPMPIFKACCSLTSFAVGKDCVNIVTNLKIDSDLQ